nr:hypothetical protein [Nocardioides panzhihuensis]
MPEILAELLPPVRSPKVSVRPGRLTSVTDALETAIGSLSAPNVPLPDALRGLLVVSRRIGAEELTLWLGRELRGYYTQGDAAGPDLPAYRSGGWPIRLGFDGPFRSSITSAITEEGLPEQLRGFSDGVGLREPIAELEALAAGEDDPEYPLPAGWIAIFRQAMSRNEVRHPIGYVLNHASVVLPRTHLRGVLDQIRTTALDLALGIEDIAPDAGETGGPTIANDPRLYKEVHVQMTNIYSIGGPVTVGDNATVSTGDNATIATGEGATAVRVAPGDVAGLLQAARELLKDEGVIALREAIQADGGEPAAATKSFLDRVKAGSYLLASGITTNAAYAGLVDLLQQTFPNMGS